MRPNLIGAPSLSETNNSESPIPLEVTPKRYLANRGLVVIIKGETRKSNLPRSGRFLCSPVASR